MATLVKPKPAIKKAVISVPKSVKDELVSEIRELTSLQEVSREATNAVNRQKTKASNAIVSWLKDGSKPTGSTIVVDGEAYGYTVAVSDSIPAETWYDLFKRKQITEVQFLAGMSVSKTGAKNAIGADQVATLCVETPGKTASFRKVELSEAELKSRKSGVHEIIPIVQAPKRQAVIAAPKAKTPTRVLRRL